MFRIATSPIAPALGRHAPVRGPARLLHDSYTKTPCRPGRTEKVLATSTGDVFKVDLASFLEWQLWAFGSYERHIAELFSYLIRAGDSAIDVGANVGVHAIRLAKLAGPSGTVIAIEPDREMAHRATENVELNGITNVHVLHAAASDRAGDSVHLYRSKSRDSNRGRGSLLKHAHLTGQTEQVETVTIDQIASGPIALVKIDVEGHEAAVVAGAAQTIAEYSPAIVFEYAPDLLAEPTHSPYEQLGDAGYEMFRIDWRRNRVTGRGTLELKRLFALPDVGADLLAVSPSDATKVSSLITPT
jgi:FkbM family methyltransferase